MSNGGDGEKQPLFTRDEVLGGVVSARRARALLFLIEYWSARLAWQARRRTAAVAAATDLAVYAPILLDDSLFQDETDVERDPDDGFYRAFGLTREGLPPANIRQIEDHAPEWARLVPDNARLRAQVARMLLQKYRIAERSAPHLRAALGLDTEAVQKAYRSQYREAIADLWAPPAPTLGERLRGLFGGRR